MGISQQNRRYGTRLHSRPSYPALVLAAGMALASALTSCTLEWENERLVYLRNRTATQVLLTWTIPCAPALGQGQWPPSAGAELALMEPESTYHPRLVQHGADTLLETLGEGYLQTMPLHVQRLPGDSVALTLTMAAGTRFVVAHYREAYRHSSTDGLQVFGFTFLPGTARWRNAAGHVCTRRFQPRVWRQAQEVEAKQKLINRPSYSSRGINLL